MREVDRISQGILDVKCKKDFGAATASLTLNTVIIALSAPILLPRPVFVVLLGGLVGVLGRLVDLLGGRICGGAIFWCLSYPSIRGDEHLAGYVRSGALRGSVRNGRRIAGHER
jgi:hypothetical protein